MRNCLGVKARKRKFILAKNLNKTNITLELRIAKKNIIIIEILV